MLLYHETIAPEVISGCLLAREDIGLEAGKCRGQRFANN